jgi:hypothetical protein
MKSEKLAEWRLRARPSVRPSVLSLRFYNRNHSTDPGSGASHVYSAIHEVPMLVQTHCPSCLPFEEFDGIYSARRDIDSASDHLGDTKYLTGKQAFSLMGRLIA